MINKSTCYHCEKCIAINPPKEPWSCGCYCDECQCDVCESSPVYRGVRENNYEVATASYAKMTKSKKTTREIRQRIESGMKDGTVVKIK